MIRKIVLALVSSIASFPAIGLNVPEQNRPYIIERPANVKGLARRMCERFDICTSMKFDRSVAIVIGVSQYKYLPKLESTKKDAERVKNYLLDSEEFDQVVFLTDGDATKERIEYFMDDYFPSLLE